MKKVSRISTIIVLAFSLFSYSCSQDETMDEIIDNTEINSPSDPDDDGEGNDSPLGDI